MKRIALMLIVLLGLSAGQTYAQADTPLKQLLDAVPAAAFEDGYLSYIDYEALIAARPGAATPDDIANLEAFRQTVEGQQYFLAMRGATAGFSGIAQSLINTEEVAQRMGISPTAIGQSLEIGFPPRQQVWLQGGIHPELVRTALAALDYKQLNSLLPSREIWCENGACENGSVVQLDKRDPAYLFGGNLGSRWPVMIEDGRVASTPNAAAFRSMAYLSGPKLSGLPKVQALLQVLQPPDSGIAVTQLFIVSPDMVLPAPGQTPSMDAIALAQVDTLDVLRVVLALHHPKTVDAQKTMDALENTLDSAVLNTGRPLMKMVQDLSGLLEGIRLEAADAGSTVVLTFRFPAQQEFGADVASAMPFQQFYRMLIQRDMGWLAP